MADDSGRKSRDQSSRQQQSGQENPQNRQPRQPAQGQGGQARSQRQRDQRQGPPRGGQPTGDDGLSRRQMLLGGGGVLAAAGGGWYFFLRNRGPVGTVEAFYAAADSGNVDKINELIHPDGNLEQVSQSAVDSTSYSIEGAEVVDENTGNSASDFDNVQEFEVVEGEVTVSSDGNENTETTRHAVAKNSDGEWKMWA